MKKLLYLLSVLTLLSVAIKSEAQNIPLSGSAQYNSSGTVKVVPSAVITVCTANDTNIPCIAKVTIYSSSSGASLSNPFNADANGNYQYFVPSGVYTETVTGVGVGGFSRQVSAGGSGSGSASFNAITNGTNTTAAMVVGTGASLSATGSGTIAATTATSATTASNLSGTPTLPNGTSASTQTTGDNTTKIATDAFVLANETPTGPKTFYAMNYGVKADASVVYDAVCTNGSAHITSATAHFMTVAKISVGMLVWTIPGAGLGDNAPSVPLTTIASIDSDTQITANANGNATCGTAQALVWGAAGGVDDTAALNTAWTTVQAATNCGTLVLPAGNMIISGGVFNTPLSTICNAQLQNNSSTITGAGWQSTDLIIAPNFDLGTCTGGSKTGCIGPGPAELRDFQVTGMGLHQMSTNPNTTASMFGVQSPNMLYNVTCQSVGIGNINLTSFSFTSALIYSYDMQAANCGPNGPTYAAGAGEGPLVGSYMGSANGVNIQSNAPGIDLYTTWIGIAGSVECAITVTGNAHFYGIPAAPGAEVCVSGGHATFTGGPISHNQGIAGRAALKITSSGVVEATGMTFTDSGAGEFSVSVDATSTFIDGCGNTYVGNIHVASGGIFIPCLTTTYPSSTSSPTETGTGSCATITTPVGTIYVGTLTCTGTTGASTIILAPGITSTHGWFCWGTDKTTTANILTQSADSATSCTLSGTVNANDVIRFFLQQY